MMKSKNMTKFKGHQSFSIRGGWLYKGLKGVKNNPEIFLDTIKAMDNIGLGSNMVKSLRYWMPTIGLTEEKTVGKERGQTLTLFGDLVYEGDLHFQKMGTLLLCHYFLACNAEKATSWYYFFNEYKQKEFIKEDLVLSLKSWVNQEFQVAESSISSDIDCLIKTYVEDINLIDFEDLKGSPFAQLGLIKHIRNRTEVYQKHALLPELIPSEIALFMILEQIEKKGRITKELSISELLEEKESIGLILNLRIEHLSLLIERLNREGIVRFIHTAGLEMLKIIDETLTSKQVLIKYYEGLKK